MINDFALALSWIVGLAVLVAMLDFVWYAIRENRKERDREYLIEVFRRRGELYPEEYFDMLEERYQALRSERHRKFPQRRMDDQ